MFLELFVLFLKLLVALALVLQLLDVALGLGDVVVQRILGRTAGGAAQVAVGGKVFKRLGKPRLTRGIGHVVLKMQHADVEVGLWAPRQHLQGPLVFGFGFGHPVRVFADAPGIAQVQAGFITLREDIQGFAKGFNRFLTLLAQQPAHAQVVPGLKVVWP